MTDPTPEAPALAPEAGLPDDEGFAALGLAPRLVETLSALGYERPTPIQRQAIPRLLAGQDLVASAATGTGKTAAFALPCIQTLEPGDGKPRVLILCPTRELALQVARAVKAYGGGAVRVLPVFGGQSIEHQLRGLDRGVDVVVGTPGRLLDHLERGSLKLGQVQRVVLDEADEMLDMGFIEDIEAILSRTPKERQTALFSATFPARIEALARKHLRDPQRLSVASPRKAAPEIQQAAYLVPRRYKVGALDRLLDLEQPASAIIFCRTRGEVDELAEELALRGFRPRALHGGLSQAQRDRVMTLFRQGGAELLIATDVAARGLDVDHVSHVINFDIPEGPDTYVHRIGRTGRAGRSGIALTLVEPRERHQLATIERVTGQRIERRYLPTVDELVEAQQSRLMLRLEAQLDEVDDGWAARVQALVSDGHDPIEVAAAALALAADALGRDQAPEDIPAGPPPAPPPRRPREETPAPRPEERPAPRGPARSAPRGGGGAQAWIFVGAGKVDGVRRGDLVGAIAHQTGLPGEAIGPIKLDQRYAKIAVPAEAADRVIAALRASGVRGKQVLVDYDRYTR